MAKKTKAKRGGEAVQLIKSLAAQGKKRTEIVSTLTSRGLKAPVSTVNYYLYKKSNSRGETSTTLTPSTTATVSLNMNRIRGILSADFLTSDDQVAMLKREILQQS